MWGKELLKEDNKRDQKHSTSPVKHKKENPTKAKNHPSKKSDHTQMKRKLEQDTVWNRTSFQLKKSGALQTSTAAHHRSSLTHIHPTPAQNSLIRTPCIPVGL